MRILENLYWVNGMIYGTLGNAYAIRHKDSLTLIDCGMEYDYEILREALTYWGLDHLPIKHVLLTHGHRDHAGNAKRLQDMGAKIYVHEDDAYQLREGGLTPDVYPHPAGLVFYMTPCEPDVLMHDSDVLDIEGETIKVIGVPGHTNGSVCFEWNTGGKQLLFTGDTCSCAGEMADEVILGWKGDPAYNMPNYIDTLKMLYQHYNPDMILGGHGFPRMREGKILLTNAYYQALLQYR